MNTRTDKYPLRQGSNPAVQTMNPPAVITQPLSITQGYGIKRNYTEETPLDLSTKKLRLSGSLDRRMMPAQDIQPENHRGLIYDGSKDRFLSVSSYSETHLKGPLVPGAASGNSYLAHPLLTDRNSSISPYVTGSLYRDGSSDKKPIHSSPENALKPPAHSILTAQYYMAGRMEGNYIHHTTTQTSFMGTGVVEQELPPLYSVLTGKVVGSSSGSSISYNPPYMADLTRPNSHHSDPIVVESGSSNKNPLFYNLPHGNDSGQRRLLRTEQPAGLVVPRDANLLYPYAALSKPNTVVTQVDTAPRYDSLLRSPNVYPSTVSQPPVTQPPGFLPHPVATPIRYNQMSPTPASIPTPRGMQSAPTFMSPVRHRLNSYLQSGARAATSRQQLPSSKQQEKAVDEHFSRSLHSLMTAGGNSRVDIGYSQKDADFNKPPQSPGSSGSDVEIIAVDGPKLSVIHSQQPNFLPKKKRLLPSVGEREVDARFNQDKQFAESTQNVNPATIFQHNLGQTPISQERPNWIKNNIHTIITNGLKSNDNTHPRESDTKLLGTVPYENIQDVSKEVRMAECKPPEKPPEAESTIRDTKDSMICSHIEDRCTGSQPSRQVTDILYSDMPHSGNTQLLDGSSSTSGTQVTIASSTNSVASNGLSGGMVNSLPRGVRYHPRPLIPDFSREDWIRMIQQHDKQIPVANVNPIIQDYTQQAESECLFYGKISATDLLGCNGRAGIPTDSKHGTTLPMDICNADIPVRIDDCIKGGTSFQGIKKSIPADDSKGLGKIPVATSPEKTSSCTSQIAASSLDDTDPVNQTSIPVPNHKDSFKMELKTESSSENVPITKNSPACESSAQETNSSIPKSNKDVNLALHFVTPKGRLKSRYARSEFASAFTPIPSQVNKKQSLENKPIHGSSETLTCANAGSTVKQELNDDFTATQTVTKCESDGHCDQIKKESERYPSCPLERKNSDEYFTKKSKLLNSRTSTPTSDHPKTTEVLNISADKSERVSVDDEEGQAISSGQLKVKEEREIERDNQQKKRRFPKKERKCMNLRERPQREAVRRKRALRRTRRFSSYHKNRAYEEELRKDEARRQRRILLRSEQFSSLATTTTNPADRGDEPRRRQCRMLLRTTRHSQKTERAKPDKRLRTDVLRKSKARKEPHHVVTAKHHVIQTSSSLNTENTNPVVFKRKRRRRKIKDLFPVKRKKTKPAKKKEETKVVAKDDTNAMDDDWFLGDVSLEEMMSFSGDTNDFKRLAVCRETGETMLHKAARLGYKDVVQQSMELREIDVNVRDNAGYSALHECCVTGQMGIAKFLIHNNADVNACALDGTRPLHDAVDNEHLQLARMLLSYGADPKAVNYAGRSPLKLAKSDRMKTFLQAFLADLNGSDHFQDSHPLECDYNLWLSGNRTRGLGYDIFSDLPSEQDDESEMQFDICKQAPPPFYRLSLDTKTGPRNYYMVSHVAERLGMTSEEFCDLHNDLVRIKLTLPEAEEAINAESLVAPDLIQRMLDMTEDVEDYLFEFVELDQTLKALLGNETESVCDFKNIGQLSVDNSSNARSSSSILASTIDPAAQRHTCCHGNPELTEVGHSALVTTSDSSDGDIQAEDRVLSSDDEYSTPLESKNLSDRKILKSFKVKRYLFPQDLKIASIAEECFQDIAQDETYDRRASLDDRAESPKQAATFGNLHCESCLDDNCDPSLPPVLEKHDDNARVRDNDLDPVTRELGGPDDPEMPELTLCAY